MEINKDSLWDIFKTFSSFKGKSEIDPHSEDPTPTPQVVKKNQFDEEKMQVIEVLYCPPEKDDLHGERMSEIEIRKMVDNFNDNINNIKGNLGHLQNTDKFKPMKAWVNETDCYIGEEFVVEGTPLVKVQFYDAELYQARKSGKLLGVSIGCMARTEEK